MNAPSVVLGLHFGHDASVAVLVDGQLRAYVLRERFNRVKHAMTLDVASVQRALAEAGLSAADVEACAVTSTQDVELFIDDPSWLDVAWEAMPGAQPPSPMAEFMVAQPEAFARRLRRSLAQHVYGDDGSFATAAYRAAFPEHARHTRAQVERVGCLDDFITVPGWDTGLGLDELARADVAALVTEPGVRHGFHAPMVVTLAGRRLPGWFFHHHAAHAGSSYYRSGFREAAILSHDGYLTGRRYHGGMCYYAREQRIYPVAPHHLLIGGLYDLVGSSLGLGSTGPAGKLMGLAGWGQPRFFDDAFVGNQVDLARRGINNVPQAWMDHCLRQARRLGYDMAPLGKADAITAPVNADIAASTQKLFEVTRLKAVRSLHAMLAGAGVATRNLCLTGGTALNCPSNSQVYCESPYNTVFVEPHCDDGGLSIGAALLLHHNLFGQPLPADSTATAYLGVLHAPAAVDAALAEFAGQVVVERDVDVGERAAADLHGNRVIALFDGRSEAGPRALGHRSILANPGDAANWARVNRIKRREWWRPFAPAVLEEEAARWFAGAPVPSPYMLFNATVRSERIPAVTHHDGTARIQTVGPGDGEFRRVIAAFHRLGGIPVVMNTSFNGPGEPVVESPREALRFFVDSELDALYLQGHRISRVAAAP